MRAIVARDVMTPEVLSIGESATLPELATFLLDNEISGAVVVNADGEPVGVVSLSDLAGSATAGGESVDSEPATFFTDDWRDTFDESDIREMRLTDEEVQVGDIMTAEIVSVDVEARISKVAKLLSDSHLHRVLVTEDDALVGIITTSDLLGLLIDDSA
ncbi:MAG: CBS domain-containing protein [Acidobacteriota bacterium]|nr:CBS domain-containing protein [Acidobacteriota bacterium]MDH3522758.1 CBS domain-containing protein [Acidobacteriota bacterium]